VKHKCLVAVSDCETVCGTYLFPILKLFLVSCGCSDLAWSFLRLGIELGVMKTRAAGVVFDHELIIIGLS